MILELKIQFNIVLYGFIAGLLTGMLYDFYKIIRGYKLPRLIRLFEDFLFCILSAMVIFLFLLYNNYAFLQPYVYISIGVAVCIYYIYISKYVLRIEKCIIDQIGRNIFKVGKKITYPIRVIMFKMRTKSK